MKKLLTLTLSLFMALSLCLTISAEDEKYFEINNQQYSTLTEALGAVSENTETTIKLLDEYTESSAIKIPSGKNIVLDLYGNDLTVPSVIVEGMLTVVDEAPKEDDADGGTLYLNSDDDEGHVNAIDGGIFVLKSGNIISNYDDDIVTVAANGGADENNPKNSKVIISGGFISGNENCIGVAGYGATVEVNGGFLCAPTAFALSTGAANSSIKVTGGQFLEDVSQYLTSDYKVTSTPYHQGYTLYTVVKNDTKSNAEETSTTSTKSYDAKDKNKDGVISCEEEMGNANWVWSESKQACVYKVTNTSVK